MLQDLLWASIYTYNPRQKTWAHWWAGAGALRPDRSCGCTAGCLPSWDFISALLLGNTKVGIKTACRDKLKVYQPLTRNSIPTLELEVTGDAAHYVHLAFVFCLKFRCTKMSSRAVTHNLRHLAPGISPCLVLQHKDQPGISSRKFCGQKTVLPPLAVGKLATYC